MAEPRHNKGKSKQDYGTPKPFLAAVRTYLGVKEFDCDLFASRTNAVCPVFYTKEQDAFTQNWKLGRGWNWGNPEFRDASKATEHAAAWKEEGAQTALLLPAGVSTDWFAAYGHNHAFVLFARPRLTFLGTPPNPKTGKPDPYPKDLMVLLYSPWIDVGYATWKWTEE